MARHALKYLSNVGKSVLYAGVDAFKEMNPVITDTIETNSDIAKATYTTLKKIKKDFKSVLRQSNTYSYLADLGGTAKNNILEDLKTGNFYNKSRADSALDTIVGEMGFGEDEDDFGFDSSDDGFSDSDEDSFDIARSLDDTGEKIANAVNTVSIRTAEYQAEVTRKTTKVSLQQQLMLHTQTHNDLMIINNNVAGLLKFDNEVMRTHVENSTLFYETQQKQMQEQTDILKEILELQKSVYVPKNKSMSSRMKISDIFTSNGAISIANYIEYIQQNRDSDGGMLGLIQDIGLGEGLVSNPLGMLMTMGIQKATPKLLKNAMKDFNESLSGAMATAIINLSKSNNFIAEMISDVAGPTGQKTSMSTAKYSKGPQPWTGKNSKALNEVIPTLLAKIYSAVSGKEELRYDYESGKFKSFSQVKRDFNQNRNRAISNANDSILPYLEYEISQIKFANAKERQGFVDALEKIMEYNFDNASYFNPRQKFNGKKYGISAADSAKYEKLFRKIYSRIPKNKQMLANKDLLEARDDYANFLEREEASGDSIFNMLFDGSITGTSKNASSSKTAASSPAMEIVYKLDETNSILSDIRDILSKGSNPANPRQQRLTRKQKKKLARQNKAKKATPPKNNRKIVSAPNIKGSRIINPHNPDTADEINYLLEQLEVKRANGKISYKDYQKEKERLEKFLLANESGSKYGLLIDTDLGSMTIDEYLAQEEEDEEAEKLIRRATREANQKRTAIEKVKDFMQGVTELARHPVQFLGNVMATVDKRLYNMLFGDDGSIADKIKDKFDELFDRISQSFKSKFEVAKEKVKDATDKALDFIDNTFGLDLREMGSNIKSKIFGSSEFTVTEGMTASITKGMQDILKQVKDKTKSESDFYKEFVEGEYTEKGAIKRKNAKEYEKIAKELRKKAKNANASEQIKADGTGETEPIMLGENDGKQSSSIPQAASGMRRVKRTGVIAASEGEMVIPQDMNPFNIKGRYKKERKAIDNFKKYYGDDYDINSYAEGGDADPEDNKFSDDIVRAMNAIDSIISLYRNGEAGSAIKKGLDKILSKYPELTFYANSKIKELEKIKKQKITKDDFVEGKESLYERTKGEFGKMLNSVLDQFSGTTKKVSDFMGQKAAGTDVSAKDAAADITKNIDQYFPRIVAGGVSGAIISGMLGLVGGPLLGAAVGASAGLISKSETLHKYLFGEKITNADGSTSHAGGLISKEITDNIDKYAPSMTKGAILGGISSFLPFTKFGPLTGVLIGSAIGFAKQNDDISKSLFGDGSWVKDAKEKLGKRLPAMIAGAVGLGGLGLLGAGAGGATGGMLGAASPVLKPIGKLISGITGVGGSHAGILTNLVLGAGLGFVADTEKFKSMIFGIKDARGERQGGLISYLKEAAMLPIDGVKDMLDWYKGAIRKYIFTPLMDFAKPLTQSFRNFGDWFKDKLGNLISTHITKPIGSKLMEGFIKPVGSVFGKITKGVLKGDFMRRALPFMGLGAIGRSWQKAQLAKVGGVSGSAADREAARLALASRYSEGSKARAEILDENSKAVVADRFLMGLSDEELDKIDNARHGLMGISNRAKNKRILSTKLHGIGEHVDGQDITQLLTSYTNKKQLTNGDYDAIIKYINEGNSKDAINLIKSRSAIPDDEKQLLVRSLNQVFSNRTNLNDDIENADSIREDILSRSKGTIDIKNVFSRRAVAEEKKFRDENRGKNELTIYQKTMKEAFGNTEMDADNPETPIFVATKNTDRIIETIKKGIESVVNAIKGVNSMDNSYDNGAPFDINDENIIDTELGEDGTYRPVNSATQKNIYKRMLPSVSGTTSLNNITPDAPVPVILQQGVMVLGQAITTTGQNIVQAIRNMAYPNSKAAMEEAKLIEGPNANIDYIETENGLMQTTTNSQGEKVIDTTDSDTNKVIDEEAREDSVQTGILSSLKGIGRSIKGIFGGEEDNSGQEKHRASLKNVLGMLTSPFKLLTGAVSGISGALGDIPVVGSLIKAIPSILPFIGIGLGISGLANTKVGTDENGNDITIKDKVASVFDEIHQGYSDAKSIALGLPGSEEATITGFGEKLGESIFTIWEGKDGKGGLKSWLDTAWSKLKSTLTSLATTLGNTIGTAIVNAINPMSEEHGDYTVTDDNGKVYGIEKGEKFTLDNGEVVEATGIREIDESRGITTEVSAKKNTRNRFSNISFSASGGGGRGSGDIFFDKNGAYNIPMKINNLHYLFKLRSRKSYKTDEGLEIFEGYGYPIYDPAQSNFYRMITSEGDEEVDAKLGLGKSYKLYDNLYTILDAMKFEEYADPDKPASVWYSTKSKTYENFMKWKYGSYDAESAQETNTSADTSSESITIPAPNITGTTSSTRLEGLENNPYQNELVSRNGTMYTWDNENNKVALIAPENASAEMKPYYDFQIRLAQLQDELLHIGDDADKRKEVFKKFLQLYQDRLNDTADENELYDYRDLIATQSNDYDKLFEMLEGMTADSDVNSLDVSGLGSGISKSDNKGSLANCLKYNNKSYKNLIHSIKYSGKASNIGVDYGSLFGMPGFNNPKAMSDKFDDAAEVPSTVFNQIQSIWTTASKAINSDVLNMPTVLSSGMRALNRFLAIAFGYASPEDKNIDFSKIVTDENYLDTRARYISENSPFYNLFAGVSGTNSNKTYTQQKAQAKATKEVVGDDTTYSDSSNESNSGTSSTGTETSTSKSTAKKSLGSVIMSGITKGVSNLAKGVGKLLGAKVAAKGSGIKDSKPVTNNGITDIGDVNPSEISFVSQKYSNFARKSFTVAGDSGHVTVAEAGCAPAVASMVINDLNSYSTPISMDEAIRTAKNYKLPNGGVTADYFVDQFKSHGLNTTFVAGQSSKKKETIVNRLRNGKPVILMGQDPMNRSKSTSPFGPYDHYVVATGISKDGRTIYINDPEAKRANIPYNLDTVINKTKLGIIPIGQGKKKAGAALLEKVKQVLRNYTARSVGRIVYIGDSRTEGMKSAVGESDTVGFCAKVGVGYEHMKSTGATFAKKELDKNSIVVFNYGVNDLYDIDQYIKFYKANYAKNKNVYYMAINPVDESKLSTHGYNASVTSNANISSFNSKLKAFAGNRFIDTYTKLQNEGFGTSDGLHYDNSTYIKIHQYVCKAVGAAANTASTAVTDEDGNTIEYSSGGLEGGTYTLGDNAAENIKNIAANITGVQDLFSIIEQLAAGWGFANASGAIGGDLEEEESQIDSKLGGSYTISGATASAEYNGEKFSGAVSTAPGAAKKQIDLVKKMLSVKEKLFYAQNNEKYPGSRNPDDGSGDCSSTVQWAYKNVTGKDIGDWTGAQLDSNATYIIQAPHSTKKWDETPLELGDILLYGTNAGGHVEMYMGNHRTIGHGGGNGPKIKDLDYRTNDCWASKRLNEFKSTAAKKVQAIKGQKNSNQLSAKGSGMPFVSQVDSRYSGMKVGDSSVAEAGCAPAVASMINGRSMASNVKDASNYIASDGGVKANYFVNQFAKAGLRTKVSDGKSGFGVGTVLLGRDSSNKSKANSPFGPNNHYVMVTGKSRDGKYTYVNDPESSVPNMRYKTSTLAKGAKLGLSPSGRGSGIIPMSALFMSGAGSKKNYSSSSPEYIVWNTMRSKGYSEIATAGAMGNIYGECAFDPSAIEAGNGHAGYGLIQWSYSRRTSLEAFCASKGYDNSDVKAQCMWLIKECTPGDSAYAWMQSTRDYDGKSYNYNDWKNAKDLYTATMAFMASFERPNASGHNFDTRYKAAQGYYESFTGKDIDSSVLGADGSSTSSKSGSSESGDSEGATSNYGNMIEYLEGHFDDLAEAWGLKSVSNAISGSSDEESEDYGSSGSTSADPNLKTSGLPSASKGQIWNWLKQHGVTDEGAAGIMGNWFVESGFRSDNLEDVAQSYAGNDTEYTNKVDKLTGKAKLEAFLKPVGSVQLGSNYQPGHAGYGLAQWTQPDSRKEGLLDLVNSRNVSISDMGTQLDWFWNELHQPTYSKSLNAVTTDGYGSWSDVATDFMTNFEGINFAAQDRLNAAQNVYNEFKGTMGEELPASALKSSKSTTTTNTKTAKDSYAKNKTNVAAKGSGLTPYVTDVITPSYGTTTKSKKRSNIATLATPTRIVASTTSTAKEDKTDKLIQIIIELLSKVVDNTMSIKDIAALVVKLAEGKTGKNNSDTDANRSAAEAKLLALNAMKQSQQPDKDDSIEKLIRSVEAIAMQ